MTTRVSKRAKTSNAISPDFAKVMLECGVVSLGGNNDLSDNKTGSSLDEHVTPSSLRASINGLLSEMHRNGTDTDNQLVLETMEHMIASPDLESSGGDQVKNGLLWKMLLPMTGHKSDVSDKVEPYSQLSQQPLDKDTTNDVEVFEVSLIKTLLRIDAVQPTLLSSLIVKLQEIATEEEEFDMNLDAFSCRQEVPRLIVSHIKWLEMIVDPISLIRATLECITVLSTAVTDVEFDGNGADVKQRKDGSNDSVGRSVLLDLIGMLSDIVDDGAIAQDPELIECILGTLRDVRVQDPTLLIPCLDAVSSLRFTTEEQVETIINDALEALESVSESWLLPALSKFLVHNVTRGDSKLCTKTIESFRRLKLGLDREYVSNEEDVNADDDFRGQIHERTDSEALMLEALSQGFTYRSDLSNALINAIKRTDPLQHGAADVWLLFCCGSAEHNKSKVKQLFQSKVSSHGFSRGLITDAIKGNGAALGHLFESSMLPLADALVRSSQKPARLFGGYLYEEMYLEFVDRAKRQDVVGQLVIHISSASSSEEIDVALGVFFNLASTAAGAQSLRDFFPFLTSLLDNVQNFSPPHLRQLFLLLFTVDCDADDTTSSGSDEIHILIHKFLALPNASAKQIGVIGAVTYAACLNEKDSPEKVREVIDMLELVHKSCAASTSSSKSQFWSQINPQGSEMLSMSVFNDELCLAIQANSLSKVIKGWVLDRFGGILENNYLGDLEVMTGDGNGNGRLVVKDKNDRSLIEGSAKNNNAPKAELRYNIDNEDAIVYLKLLSLHASEKYQEREVLPHQLCPLLRLMTVAYDERYGGDGIDNIDALLGCPVLLPDSSICGVDFTYLSDEQKLTTVSTLFTAVSCFREIINSFIYTAVFGPSGCTQLTQEHENLRKKVVTKLRFLLILEEELILCAKKCHSFAPPGTSPLPIPKDLSDYAEKNNLQHVTNDLPPVDTEDVGRMTEREKKAFNNIKRAAKRKEMEQMKSKQKLLRLKAKYENSLETRTRSALRSLSPYVSLALGFPELRVTGLSASNQELITPLRTSELKCTKIGDGVTHSLLQLFNDGLKALLNHDSSHSSNFYFENFTANPYVISKEGAKVQRQRNECQTFLLSCIEGDVFVSVHERLVSAAEILSDDEIDEDVKKEATTCTLLLMGCMEILLNSNELKSLEGKPYFDTIIKQIADGERTSTIFTAMPDTTRLKTIRALFALLEETVTGRDTNDLTFVITGVECIHLLVQRASAIIDGAREDEKKSYSNYLKSMKLQLSKLCQDLLRRQWKEGTSLNKSNVGILLSLFLEYSELECANLSTSNFDPMKWGRINAINVLTTQALLKLPETHECKGPVQEFSTCYRSTFGLFYSAVLNAITKEISDLFQSPQSKMVENAGACLSTLKILISMTLAMSDLLKNNPSLASRSNLLTQIKIGTKFVDVTVKRAIPFCAAHFQSFDETIVEMLKDIQKISSQLSFIVAHGKRIKDTYLIREGPNVRKSTEGFLHHTKSVLQKNGVLDAFWSGHFNNRNIDGSKVVERTRQESDSAAESSDTESEVEYE